MTACVNKNHGRRVAGVVTASLVGALTLGGVSLAAVPTVALAEQGADAQFVKPGSELTNASANAIWFGKSTDYTDGSNKPDTSGKVPTYKSSVVDRSLTDVWVNAADGTLVTAMTGGVVDSDYQVAVYKAGEDGAKTGSALAGNKVVESGSYVLEVTAVDGDYAGQTFSWRFDVAGKEFGTVAQYGYAYFTGSELSAAFSSDGSKLKSSDYTVSYTQNGKEAKVLHAGTYTATLTGQGQYAGSSATATVEVKPFDLTNAKVTVDPFTGAAPTHASSITAEFDTGVDGKTATYSLDPSVLGLSWFGESTTPGGVKPSVTVSGVDTYYAKVAGQDGKLNVSDDYKGDVTGTAPLSTKTAKVKDMASFRYLGKDLADLTFDKSQGQAFTANSLSAYLGSKKLSSDTSQVKYEVVSGTKADGRTPTASGDFEAGVPGTYVVRVAFPSVTEPWDSTNYAYAASQTIKVTYTQGALDADQYVTVKYGNKIVDSVTKAYDGKPVKATDFTVTAKDADGEPVNVKPTLYGEDGKAVDEATEAGKYTLKVEATDGHTLTGTTELPVTINKVDLSSAKVGKLQKWNDATQSGEEYVEFNSGAKFNTYKAVQDALAPVYQTGVEASDAEGADDPLKDAFKGTDNKGLDYVPENVATKVEFNDEGTWKQVNDFTTKGEGEYRLTLSVASDVAKNYVLPEGAESVVLTFKAVTDNSFSDVQPSDWYYKYVNKAAEQRFMGGDKDAAGAPTGNFRPESALTRAEAVTVLYNMSGQSGNENGGSNEGDFGYETGFDDVASSHWASKYVAWAKRSGVVNGYDGTNDFRPDQTVTRNEFAKMLFNYAKNVAKDGTTGNVDTSALKFSDGVDGWAQEAVAWAVSTPSKFEGETDSTVVSGYPQDNTFRGGNNVLRAEVAKMAVSYQTKALR